MPSEYLTRPLLTMPQRMEAIAHKAADAYARNDWMESQRLYTDAVRLAKLIRSRTAANTNIPLTAQCPPNVGLRAITPEVTDAEAMA